MYIIQYVKNRQIIILENLVVNARRIFIKEGYMPTMNNSSMDNIIGLPNIINKTLSTKEKINIFISRFVIKESNITIFILVKTPKFLFI